jgi:hypothetical protein
MTEPMQIRVCATCQQPLNRWHRGTVEKWSHPGREETDHEPVPIPISEATHVRHVCDFCGGDHVAWIYPTDGEIRSVIAAQRFTDVRDTTRIGKHWKQEANRPGQHKDLQDNRFNDEWTACKECSALIEIPDMERLITRLRRVKPESFASVSRTLLRTHFGEFFRLKQERRPLDASDKGARRGAFHEHGLPTVDLPPDPDGLAVDLRLIHELIGAAVEQCVACQKVLTTQVADDPVTTCGILDLALRGINDRVGFVPDGMTKLDAREGRPGVQSRGFRTVAHASANGTDRPAAAEAAAQLTQAERRTIVEESLDVILGLLAI